MLSLSIASCIKLSESFLLDRCEAPLGMEDRTVSDTKLTASSMHNHNHGPWRARLWHRNSGGTGAWSAKYNNRRQWIQVICVSDCRVVDALDKHK